MNYTEIAQIENIHHEFKVRGNDLYFMTKDSRHQLAKMDLDSHEISAEKLDGVRSFKFFGDWVVATRLECKKLTFYDLETSGIIHEIDDFQYVLNVLLDKCNMVYEKADEEVLCYRNICNDTDELIMSGTIDYFSVVYDGILISASAAPFRRTIIAYNLKTRSIAWEFDLREIGKFYSLFDKEWLEGYALDVKIVNDRVYISTYPNLLCLNIKTGSVLWQVEVKPDIGSKFTFDETTKEIILFDYHQLHFIDAITGSIIRSSTSLYERIKEMGMSTFYTTTPFVYGNNIYLTLCNYGKILILDKHNFEIVHMINMTTVRDSISTQDAPIVYGNKIFQRSDDGVMHVYADQ